MARRASRNLAILALLMVGCGPLPPPQTPLPPSPLASPTLGVVDGFHGLLPAAILARYCSYGRDLVIRTPQLSRDGFGAMGQALASACVGRSLGLLALVEAPDPILAGAVASLAPQAIENGNELELPPHNLTPPQYANAQAAMLHAEGLAGFVGEVIMGGVYALTDDTKQAIDLALPYCRLVPHCMVGVHLYVITEDDVKYLNTLDADIAITETGSPTNCQPAKLPQQAAYLRDLYARAQQIHRLKYFVVYQGGDGPGCSDLDSYGIRGKPAEQFFRP